MANIEFTVPYRFEAPAKPVWDELVDWAGHAAWIPATRVEVAPGDPTAPGATFTAWTGIGKLSLEDRMRVVSCDWDDASQSGACEVEKLGPILLGRAAFTVTADGDGARLEWVEDVRVKRVPQFVAPVAAKIGALGFKQGMRKLAKLLASRSER
jgi:uncharacterized protein YndB with AHSA1/START domain